MDRGERVETAPEGAADLDLKFYDIETGNLDQITDAVALAIAEEGEVPMKNNGVLPLAEGSSVTPFGYRYISPICGGTGYSDGTAHQLALSEDEKAMIRFAKANCTSVVVILNTSNVIEISELARDSGDLSANAILWVGGPGAQGFAAMGSILSGQVNPSGKTVDIWMTDLMEVPSTYNFGNYEYGIPGGGRLCHQHQPQFP